MTALTLGQPRRLCIILPNAYSPSETFLRAHAECLPARTTVIHGGTPEVDGVPIKSQFLPARAWRKLGRWVLGRTWMDEVTSTYMIAFNRYRPEGVLAEYGGAGVGVMEACRKFGVPLVVHFHGWDASSREYVQELAESYRKMFQFAAGIVAVSRAMRRTLIELGAPAEKVHWNPCGVDCAAFEGGNPALTPPIFLAVGRFTPKKSPERTIKAFAKVYREIPEARLRMVGFGPLLEPCQQLTRQLKLEQAVTFLGTCSQAQVQQEMRQARCFVQHSVVGPDGDAEGTPVSILEAGASGLPVVATRHMGICDVVVEHKTGLLVDEGDVDGMALAMLQLAHNPQLAGQLGHAARTWIASNFSLRDSIHRLWAIIDSAIAGHPLVAAEGSLLLRETS